jgi:hypothetical protein
LPGYFCQPVVTVILVAKKFSPYWLLITGLLAIAYTAFSLSKLNTEFSLDNIVRLLLLEWLAPGLLRYRLSSSLLKVYRRSMR